MSHYRNAVIKLGFGVSLFGLLCAGASLPQAFAQDGRNTLEIGNGAIGKKFEGSVEFSTSSFFKSSPDRNSWAGTMGINMDLSSRGSLFEARAQLEGVGYLNSLSSISPEAPNLYIATRPDFSKEHELTLGRRVFQWSVADDRWKLGAWSPRFLWDMLRPETVGLMGLTYQYRSGPVTLRLFASPISVPERGVPVAASSGQLSSADPDWRLPYLSVALMNQGVPISYSIQLPGMGDLLVHPSALLYTRVGAAREGAWGSVTAGVKPINPPDLTAAANLTILPSPYIDARIQPRVVMHQLGTLEGGYQGTQWNFWGSLSREIPLPGATADGYQANPMGPTWISSGGVDYTGFRSIRLSASALWINETTGPLPADAVPLTVPARYEFYQAVNLRGEWTQLADLVHSVGITRDIQERNLWLSLDTMYRFNRARWRVGLGADFFANATADGTLGPYSGNDRVRAKVVYEF